MSDTVKEVRMNSLETFSNGPLHTDMHVLANQQELIYNSSAAAGGGGAVEWDHLLAVCGDS